MSTGTSIIKRALQMIGAHSVLSPAAPGDIVLGMEKLNSMLELWLSRNIDLNVTPLEVPGDDLDEPTDTNNGIVSNLAIYLSPFFDNGQVVVSQALKITADRDFLTIKNIYQQLVIPKKGVSSTLPRGAGNTRGTFRRTFVGKKATIGN